MKTFREFSEAKNIDYDSIERSIFSSVSWRNMLDDISRKSEEYNMKDVEDLFKDFKKYTTKIIDSDFKNLRQTLLDVLNDPANTFNKRK